MLAERPRLTSIRSAMELPIPTPSVVVTYMSMQTAVIKILAIGFVVIVLVIGVVLLLQHNALPSGNSSGGSTAPPGQIVHVSAVKNDLPTGSTITIGTSKGIVMVNNFYLSDPPILSDGTSIDIAETDQFEIQYDTAVSGFWIIISGSPFAAGRSVAEAAFLNTLGVDQGDACKLSVIERVDPYTYASTAENTMIGKSFPLSFCPATGL